MNVTIEQLLQLIGEQQVELALLRRELARLAAPAAADLGAASVAPARAPRPPLAMAARPDEAPAS